MSDISARIGEIHALETLSGADSAVHRLHPTVKLVSSLVFIVAVVSFGRYDFARLAPFLFYPFVMMALSDTPYKPLLKRLLIALPFCLFAGISNVIFDRELAFILGGVPISFGALSLVSILLKMYLTVMAALLLVATTPFTALTASLRSLRVPSIFVTVFEMTYRYIGVLLEEVSLMSTAYALRHTRKKGLEMRHMGSFLGQLILRSFDRAERVYAAMKCRGYASVRGTYVRRSLRRADVIVLAVICALAVLFRVFSLDDVWRVIRSC